MIITGISGILILISLVIVFKQIHEDRQSKQLHEGECEKVAPYMNWESWILAISSMTLLVTSLKILIDLDRSVFKILIDSIH